jgi:hypothetical protein
LAARDLKTQAENLFRQFALLERELIGIHFPIFLKTTGH